MAKRFTDTEKWRDAWFRRLSPTHKCLWIYFLDICDHAGILEIDKELAEFSIGCQIDWDETFDIFKGRIRHILEDKYFVQKFIDFQYGTLNNDNRVHLSVINLLKKQGLYKGLISSINGVKDKDKDKDKDKSKDKVKNKKPEIFWPTGFLLTEEMRDYAISKGVTDPGDEFQAFHDWAISKNAKYADWKAGWRTRCRKYLEYNPRSIKPQVGTNKLPEGF